MVQEVEKKSSESATIYCTMLAWLSHSSEMNDLDLFVILFFDQWNLIKAGSLGRRVNPGYMTQELSVKCIYDFITSAF